MLAQLKARARSSPVRTIGAGILLCAAIAAGALALSWGSPAPKARAEFHLRVQPIGPLPPFATAVRRGVADFLGQRGHSRIAWNSRTGLWGGHTKPNWWQSALAVLTLVRYAERIHDRGGLIQQVLLRIYHRNVYKPYATARFDFANEFGDDTAWWGQAWLEASRYELYIRHNLAQATRFLSVAEWDADYVWRMPRSCGGIPWALNRPADTVTSAEFATLTARLADYREHSGPFHDPARAAVWLKYAWSALDWLHSRRLINYKAGTVYDGLNSRCRIVGGPMTYTQGEMAEALIALGNAVHQPVRYRQAERFLRYALSRRSQLTARGILRERCEIRPGGCGRLHYHLDLGSYKGIFVLAASDWDRATGTHTFARFLQAQARAVLTRALEAPGAGGRPCAPDAACQFGFYWTDVANPSPNTLGATVGSQQSALDALISVLPDRGRLPG